MRLVVGVDLGTHGLVEALVPLAKRLDAKVVLVHAVGPGLIAGAAGLADVLEDEPDQTEHELREEDHARLLDERAMPLHDAGIEVQVVVAHDDPAELLERTAEKEDWIVVGRADRGPIAQAFLNNTDEDLVRTAKHPVLVLPL